MTDVQGDGTCDIGGMVAGKRVAFGNTAGGPPINQERCGRPAVAQIRALFGITHATFEVCAAHVILVRRVAEGQPEGYDQTTIERPDDNA